MREGDRICFMGLSIVAWSMALLGISERSTQAASLSSFLCDKEQLQDDRSGGSMTSCWLGRRSICFLTSESRSIEVGVMASHFVPFGMYADGENTLLSREYR